MSNCQIFTNLPSNKKGWYYVWDFRSWCCGDYNVYCEKCRESSELKEKQKQ